MTTVVFLPVEGRCACGSARYRLLRAPMFVHCCHCTWCQRETGTAFALNALVEADAVDLLSGDIEIVDTPTASGKGQRVARCRACKVALWSNYSAAGSAVRFLRVGTLDQPDRFPPDIHIFTTTKQGWLRLAGDVPVVAEYYRRSEHWPKATIDRYKKALAAGEPH